MSWPIPHSAPAKWPGELHPRRFASRIHAGLAAGCRVAILGLPDDLGVRLNAGRPGAAGGPKAFREALAQYGASTPAGWEYPHVFDAGDVQPAPGHDEGALHETHKRVTEAVREIVKLGMMPIGIGGGHDLTFPFVRGVIESVREHTSAARFEGVYFDAHLDVRETVGSGMPFRRLVEECGASALDLIGFGPLVNSQEHVEWFLSHGGRLAPSESFPRARETGAHRFVSFDLDALDARRRPGCSAMNPAGLTTARAETLVLAAGRCPSVACFDIMELNPAFDDRDRTARVAAHLFLTFLRGFAERSDAQPFNPSRYA